MKTNIPVVPVVIAAAIYTSGLFMVCLYVIHSALKLMTEANRMVQLLELAF
jgi:hypothetical protein